MGSLIATAVLRPALEAVCARVCHDVSGPLGTLLGALECATDSSAGTDDEAFDLAQEAAQALVARLRLVRAAWAGPDEEMSAAAMLALLEGLAGRERLRIDLSGLPPRPLPAAIARVSLNVIMLAADALPGGGTITISPAADAAMSARISGPGAAWPAALAACLADPSGIAARLAGERRPQAHLTVLLAAGASVRLGFLAGADGEPASLLIGAPP